MKPHLFLWTAWLLGFSASAQTSEEGAAPPPAQAPAASAGLAAAQERLRQALAGRESLALLPVELNGTDQGAQFLEQALLQAMQAEGRLLVDPRQAFLKLGVEFQLSESALGQAAEQLQVEALVFPRLFVTPRDVELYLWAVSREGKTLFEETFSIELPPPETAAESATWAKSAPPPSAPGKVSLLALAPRVRGGPGISVGFATGNVSLGVHTPPSEGQDWMITEDGQPISEARLAELAGRKDILQRMEKAAGRFRVWRNVGIGLAISGFVVTAAALPYYKQGNDQGLTAASAAVAGGTLLGATGLVLWLNYATLAYSAYSPFPSRHFIDIEEAQEMIEEVNLRRVKESSPPVSENSGRLYFGLIPAAGTLGAVVGGVF